MKNVIAVKELRLAKSYSAELKIHMTESKTHDSFFGSLVPPETNHTYTMDLDKFKPLPFAYLPWNTHISASISIDYRKSFINRSVYNIFDFVKDIGGLISGLHNLFVIIVAVTKFQDLHFWMAK